ncbi:DUF6344 domain-containing protein [Streptomyces beihaiensis]|uniref:DUF6344 domain-containing protein n=1 Tax=Streptomyces beihaiensis TaxID=2984495 RepID=A0ABT3U362_9ACTN|nr:DUF6344 domain-containing protein [Streptomyces beihaiensis]MCX3063757.1 DUF6344 domain-containing protein [Streptomyces beihaiensis]
MTKNRVMTLWTVVISAFIALFSALGIASPAAAATPVQQTQEASNSAATAPAPTTARPFWAFKRKLPPTMKQRISAEAHGTTPGGRHHDPADQNDDAALATEQ